ncbi:uncharacterized protein L3040_005761 [Drepanopeziza brunnea f. sp. 'multigermtubi']|uniref:Ferric-chelate reductase n=1 Tax=Marssonina brunnea f. sp. multigermtubi (strain MB_m1) TaxID=1072389 RepID=K1WVU7_MARBU|nr:ferric-chelate reductase [Drepanopeziza brunnea f. sp. 'multigermtubi' MB_m1]EKD21775.1 ferric-chelate reductase [Drepanopeziza brunnea f. sp. 'multigermtubi' MB_m1]KAJ5041210.1 hypothetical protein L3040_005761 [Drepanopeziza brunnea f. sp. 'multigermtubi']
MNNNATVQHGGHIQVASDDSYFVKHWGYHDRTLPCTNDPGSCAYLDAIYWMHDVSMLYTFIMWAVIGGILAIVVLYRVLAPRPGPVPTKSAREAEGQRRGQSSAWYRASRAIQSSVRRWLLPERFVGLFGHTTSLQVLILMIILAYLLIFSLVGIVYKTWITPVKGTTNLFNQRSGIGGFADRVGALAYALTPFTVALGSRESMLTILTGLPYQSFNFLHRWTGRIILVQSALHTFGWTLIEANFYKPQPEVYQEFIKQTYIIWGCVALVFICFLSVFSLPVVARYTGHEFFRKAHYVAAGLYFGACWAHWSRLACWMIASLGIWGLDRGLRFLRTALIHTGHLHPSKGFGFHSAQSSLQYFDDEDGGVVRLEFQHNHDTWAVGQHFFLTFPALSIWQSHPLTVASVPAAHPAIPHHTYIVRARRGETGRLKTLALSHAASPNPETTPIVLSGPYGAPLLPSPSSPAEPTNILAIAGGTGISLTLPLALAATSLPSTAAIDFVWVIRRASSTQWIASELETLKRRAAQGKVDLKIHLYITRESPSQTATETATEFPAATPEHEGKDIKKACESSSSLSSLSSSANFTTTYLPSHRPSLHAIVTSFLETRANAEYRTRVIASGPACMGHDLRSAVAASNDGAKVWKNDRRWDVELEWDDRMG